MREGIKRTPVELLRAAIEEQKCEMPCGALHELHGDEQDICNDRNCIECGLDALRKAADLVEEELDALKARALPEGMEWPRFESGELVLFGDEFINAKGNASTLRTIAIKDCRDALGGAVFWKLGKGACAVTLKNGERVKRPERKDSRPDGCCHPGSYECDELAFRDQNSGEDVYADKCLVPELRRLRESGIRTLGSCCGHGTTRPNIVVAPECEGAMRRQGYEGRRNKFGVLEFAAKSSCPAPKVRDADGVEIHVGDTVCGTRDMEPMRVVDTDSRECGFKHIKCEKEGDGFWFYCPDELTHKLPVIAADGEPLEVGQTVWDENGRGPLTVWRLPDKSDMHVSLKKDGTFYYRYSEKLTHERPESKCRDCAHWQKDPTADNMGVCWFFYHEHEGQDCYAARLADIGACEEFMPRAKALADEMQRELDECASDHEIAGNLQSQIDRIREALGASE